VAGPLVLLLSAALVLLSAAAVTRLLRPEGRLDAAVTGGVVAVALVALAVLATGAAGVLRPQALLAAHGMQALLAVALLARRGSLRVRLRPPGWADLRAAPWETGLVGLAALALGWQLLVALVLPPYSYDALTYHLTTVAGWVQSESLAPSQLSLCCAYYPLNAELLTAWAVVLLGNDALTGTVQVLAAVLGAAAVGGIGRTAGLSRGGAAAAGALFVLTPAVLAQAPTAYVDVLLAALVLAALHGLARFTVTARASRLVAPALAAGLLAGTKGTGVFWAAGLVATAAVLAALLVRRGRLTPARAAGALAGVVGACLLLGAWWYVRSAVDTGNPLYPFELRAGGRTLFDGPQQLSDVLTQPDRGGGHPWPVAVLLSWADDLLPWRHGSYDYQQRSGGLGPLWVWLGLPLLVPFAVRLWRERGAALAVLLPVLALLLVQPYRWWARFTLPLAAVGIVAVVAAVERRRRGPVRHGLQTATALLAAAGAALVLVEVNPASRAEPLPAARVVGLLAADAEERTLGRLFLPEYRFLEQVPADATVLVDLRAGPVRFVYPLFGRDLGRTVLAAGEDPVPDSAWVVTSQDRPLDAQMAARRSVPASDVRGVRVWAPTS
jgi:hypothetical protein